MNVGLCLALLFQSVSQSIMHRGWPSLNERGSLTGMQITNGKTWMYYKNMQVVGMYYAFH